MLLKVADGGAVDGKHGHHLCVFPTVSVPAAAVKAQPQCESVQSSLSYYCTYWLQVRRLVPLMVHMASTWLSPTVSVPADSLAGSWAVEPGQGS